MESGNDTASRFRKMVKSRRNRPRRYLNRRAGATEIESESGLPAAGLAVAAASRSSRTNGATIPRSRNSCSLLTYADLREELLRQELAQAELDCSQQGMFPLCTLASLYLQTALFILLNVNKFSILHYFSVVYTAVQGKESSRRRKETRQQQHIAPWVQLLLQCSQVQGQCQSSRKTPCTSRDCRAPKMPNIMHCSDCFAVTKIAEECLVSIRNLLWLSYICGSQQ